MGRIAEPPEPLVWTVVCCDISTTTNTQKRIQNSWDDHWEETYNQSDSFKNALCVNY